MATKHINAEPDDIAPTVLMPGDPLRAQYIAETYLDEPRRVNEVRNMWAYTGRHRGQLLTVFPHGMGIPSCSIYCQELVESYGVRRLIRVGSCGSVRPEIRLRDVVIGMGACTDSKVNRMRFGDHDFAPIADFELLRRVVEVAEARGLRHHVGNLFSADLFYTPQPELFARMAQFGIVGVEMEAAGIYAIAAEHGVQALAICTVSDDIIGGEHLSSEERQNSFDDMIQLALATVADGPDA
jgi:purine-nucleoside phosphorylase